MHKTAEAQKREQIEIQYFGTTEGQRRRASTATSAESNKSKKWWLPRLFGNKDDDQRGIHSFDDIEPASGSGLGIVHSGTGGALKKGKQVMQLKVREIVDMYNRKKAPKILILIYWVIHKS
eukprot:UN22850